MGKDILRYYLVLRMNGQEFGVRQAQRVLGLSSPGKAQRILNRMVKEGLMTRREDGKYVIVKDPPPELVGKLVIKGRVYPRILIYATYATVLASTYTLLTRPGPGFLLVEAMIVAPLWLEAIIEYFQIRKQGL